MFITSIALGFMLSTVSKDIVQSFAFSRLLSTLFTTLPPVYYPITYVPLPYRYVAYVSPTTWAGQIVQTATGYLTSSMNTIIIEWGVLAAVTAAILVIAVKKTQWRET